MKPKLLKLYTAQARKSGYKVMGGDNGGGWIRLAQAVGFPVTTKSEARRILSNNFAWVRGENKPVKNRIKQNRPRSAFVATDAFLASYEWRKLRMHVLKRDGARCRCCGASPADWARMHVDHIKPRKLFPLLALDLSNLQVLCSVCNHGKGNWDTTNWRDKSEKHDAVTVDISDLADDQKEHIKSILH